MEVISYPKIFDMFWNPSTSLNTLHRQYPILLTALKFLANFYL